MRTAPRGIAAIRGRRPLNFARTRTSLWAASMRSEKIMSFSVSCSFFLIPYKHTRPGRPDPGNPPVNSGQGEYLLLLRPDRNGLRRDSADTDLQYPFLHGRLDTGGTRSSGRVKLLRKDP